VKIDRTIPYRPPVEIVDGARASSLRAVGGCIAAATLVAFVVGSRPLLAWTNELPIGPVSDFLLYLAQWWHDRMTELGVAGFADGARAILRAFQGAR
jgi:hypothetical protein